MDWHKKSHSLPVEKNPDNHENQSFWWLCVCKKELFMRWMHLRPFKLMDIQTLRILVPLEKIKHETCVWQYLLSSFLHGPRSLCLYSLLHSYLFLDINLDFSITCICACMCVYGCMDACRCYFSLKQSWVFSFDLQQLGAIHVFFWVNKWWKWTWFNFRFRDESYLCYRQQ